MVGRANAGSAEDKACATGMEERNYDTFAPGKALAHMLLERLQAIIDLMQWRPV